MLIINLTSLAAPCIYLSLSNVFINLAWPPVLFQHHVLPAQSQPASLCVSRGAVARELRAGYLRVGFLVGAAFLYRPEDSSLQTNGAGGNCLELGSWTK